MATFSPFTPWRPPTSPPPGTYDPAFDQQYRSAERGFGDLLGQAGTDVSRAQTDYFQGQGDITTTRDRSLAGLLRMRTRGTEDFGTARTRLGEDHGRATQGNERSYRRLGEGQAQQARAAGVASGGTLAQALRKRTENQAYDQFDIDRGRDRGMADIGTGERRLGEDVDTQTGYVNADHDRDQGRLTQGFERYGGDLATRLATAGRELGTFGVDTAESKFFQAAQAGSYVMPSRGEPGGQPSNEFTKNGQTYRVIQQGAYNLRVAPDGTVLSKTRRA